MAPDKRSGFLDFIKIIKWHLFFCSQEMWFSASSCDPGKLTAAPPVYREFPHYLKTLAQIVCRAIGDSCPLCFVRKSRGHGMDWMPSIWYGDINGRKWRRDWMADGQAKRIRELTLMLMYLTSLEEHDTPGLRAV